VPPNELGLRDGKGLVVLDEEVQRAQARHAVEEPQETGEMAGARCVGGFERVGTAAAVEADVQVLDQGEDVGAGEQEVDVAVAAPRADVDVDVLCALASAERSRRRLASARTAKMSGRRLWEKLAEMPA
jgi:hypothetical protein